MDYTKRQKRLVVGLYCYLIVASKRVVLLEDAEDEEVAAELCALGLAGIRQTNSGRKTVYLTLDGEYVALGILDTLGL
jgi:hypothetical protein